MDNPAFEKLISKFKKFKIISILSFIILLGALLIYISASVKINPKLLEILSALGYNFIAAGIIGFTFEWLIRYESRAEMENLLLFNPKILRDVIKPEKIKEIINTLCKVRFPNSELRERILKNVLLPLFNKSKQSTELGVWDNYNCKIELLPVELNKYEVTINVSYNNSLQVENYLRFSCVRGANELDKRLGKNYEWVYFLEAKNNPDEISNKYKVLDAFVDGLPLRQESVTAYGKDALEVKFVPGKEGDIKGYNRHINHTQKILATFSSSLFFYKFPTTIKNFKLQFSLKCDSKLLLRMDGIVLSGAVDVYQPKENEIHVTIRDYCPVQGRLMFLWS